MIVEGGVAQGERLLDAFGPAVRVEPGLGRVAPGPGPLDARGPLLGLDEPLLEPRQFALVLQLGAGHALPAGGLGVRAGRDVAPLVRHRARDGGPGQDVRREARV
ncbi:hypothetical protein L1885_24920, partial [Streptomyces fuscigenes]